jgi:hypothetical protein
MAVSFARQSSVSVATASVMFSGLNLNEDANANIDSLADVVWGRGMTLAAVDDLSGGADVVDLYSQGSLSSVQVIGTGDLGITTGTGTESVVTAGLTDAVASAAFGYTTWTEALSL